jgi:hypothetical protein
MTKESLISKTQALAIKELGFNEPTSHYVLVLGKVIHSWNPDNYNNSGRFASVPTVDEAVDWLRRKYNIVIYNKIEPFVDPTDLTHKTILFRYGIKRCDTTNLGWNGRLYIGETRLDKNVYSLKREAITIALKYIKNRKK